MAGQPPPELRRDAGGRLEPGVAVGHVELAATDVARTSRFLEALGLLAIVVRDDFAVLEFRGGTHVVVQRAEEPLDPESSPAFDLMVDDLEAARQRAEELGAEPSPIEHGRIHSSFALRDPSGQRLHVVSSHTVWKPV